MGALTRYSVMYRNTSMLLGIVRGDKMIRGWQHMLIFTPNVLNWEFSQFGGGSALSKYLQTAYLITGINRCLTMAGVRVLIVTILHIQLEPISEE